ncbi:diol dehydratase small subunit [Chloroflexi bacterium TSY]|nr:diol dehydratase small subunit [Chloroflexi bacterium TSY]
MSRAINSLHYPLIDHSTDLQAANGRPMRDITIDAAAQGTLSTDDLQIHSQTLHTQAKIAQESGYPQLAENLDRAAELTRVPNDELLAMYEQLRPGRSTLAELQALAERLHSQYQAPRTAQLVNEAATVYQTRGLLRKDTTASESG